MDPVILYFLIIQVTLAELTSNFSVLSCLNVAAGGRFLFVRCDSLSGVARYLRHSLQAGSSVENGACSKHPLTLKMARGQNIRAW